jgi:hypothetical protein
MTPYQRNVVPLSLGVEGPRKSPYSLTFQKRSVLNSCTMEIPNPRRPGSSTAALWKFQAPEDLDPQK